MFRTLFAYVIGLLGIAGVSCALAATRGAVLSEDALQGYVGGDLKYCSRPIFDAAGIDCRRVRAI